MDQIGRGIIAGFLATLFLSSVVHPIARIVTATDVSHPAIGWLLHFLVGTFIWGALFGAVQRVLPGAPWVRGLIFGIVAWLIAMVALLPLTRAGLFGLNIGVGAPAGLFAAHVAYGLLLGSIFGFLDPRPQADDHEHDDHWHPVAH